MADKFVQRGANVLQTKAATAGHHHGGKIFLGDDVKIEVKNKFARVRVQMI